MEEMNKKIEELQGRLDSLARDYLFWTKKINSVQSYQGTETDFDPDSSPKAWEHYLKYYQFDKIGKADNNKNYNNDYNELHYYNYLTHQKYIDYPLIKSNRLHSFPLDTKPVTSNSDCGNVYRPTESLSGETDFNFNSKKIIYYEKFFVYPQYTIDEHIKNLLETLYNMHHTLVNFSLMQSMGGRFTNCQVIKSSGFKFESNYEWLDRLDSFVYFLFMYYCNDTNDWRVERISNALPNSNIGALKNYLDSFYNENLENKTETNHNNTIQKYDNKKAFASICNYCQNIYFITDIELIDRLIESGKQPINCTNRVIEYIELAICFWEAKAAYFKSKDEQCNQAKNSTPE